MVSSGGLGALARSAEFAAVSSEADVFRRARVAAKAMRIRMRKAVALAAKPCHFEGLGIIGVVCLSLFGSACARLALNLPAADKPAQLVAGINLRLVRRVSGVLAIVGLTLGGRLSVWHGDFRCVENHYTQTDSAHKGR